LKGSENMSAFSVISLKKNFIDVIFFVLLYVVCQFITGKKIRQFYESEQESNSICNSATKSNRIAAYDNNRANYCNGRAVELHLGLPGLNLY
jgi:hypothetical protein